MFWRLMIECGCKESVVEPCNHHVKARHCVTFEPLPQLHLFDNSELESE